MKNNGGFCVHGLYVSPARLPLGHKPKNHCNTLISRLFRQQEQRAVEKNVKRASRVSAHTYRAQLCHTLRGVPVSGGGDENNASPAAGFGSIYSKHYYNSTRGITSADKG